MSQEALGLRLGVTKANITKLERSELSETISIGKLADVARAMDCRLVYALVPNTSLEHTVRQHHQGDAVGHGPSAPGRTEPRPRRQVPVTLHRRMFEDVWRWAGTQRRRETNIGVEPAQIPTQTKQALDDASYWHTNDVFDIDERAARIHRRLVAVHPFPNGNGRCTRLVADLYLRAIDRPIFTWGAGGKLDENSDPRQRYLDALHAADGDNHTPLVTFARS